MAARGSIPDFSIANLPYALSQVTVHIANPDGSKGALATLFAGPTGPDTLSNPQTLDPTGKWSQPVYVSNDVILDIDAPGSSLDGETGIVSFGGKWRGAWTGPGTRYDRGDRILGPIGAPEESNVYVSSQVFSSGATWAADLATPGLFDLELDYQALKALAISAVPLADEVTAGRIEIATQAEANAGLLDNRAITPLKLATMQATETQKGVAEVATQAETNAGSNDTTMVTPAKLHARVSSTTLQGLIAIATQAEVDGSSNNTEAVTPTTLWATPMRGGWRNKIANGHFEIWQRGAGGAAAFAVGASSNVYGPDRWYLGTGANQASTITQLAGIVGRSRYSCKVQRNAGQTGTTQMAFGFPLDTDEIIALRGQQMCLVAVLNAGANWSPASGTITVEFRIGAAAPAKRVLGAYAGDTLVFSGSINMAQGSVVNVLTAVSAGTVPTTATCGEVWFLWTPVGAAGADDSFTIDDVAMENGPVASAGERRFFGYDLLECQRHYYKSFDYAVAPATNLGFGNAGLLWRATNTGAVLSISQMFNLPIPMRNLTGTGVVYNPAAANNQVRNGTDAADCTGAAVAVYHGRYLISFTGNAGQAPGEDMRADVTIDSGI